MRSYYIIAIAAVLAIGFGVKLNFSAPIADANMDAVKSLSIDASNMQTNAKLPIEKIHDMTFVFAAGD